MTRFQPIHQSLLQKPAKKYPCFHQFVYIPLLHQDICENTSIWPEQLPRSSAGETWLPSNQATRAFHWTKVIRSHTGITHINNPSNLKKQYPTQS